MFSIGDRVKITNTGCIYNTYREWAHVHNLIGWEENLSVANGTLGSIVKLGPHSLGYTELIAGVRLEGTDKIVIMDLKGIKKLTKKDMSDGTLQGVLKEAIDVKNKIKRIEVEVLADLKEHLKQLSEKLMRELSKEGIDGASNENGSVVVVNRKGSVTVDKEALMKDLELDNLSKYEQQGKGSKFLKYTITKKIDG